MSPRISPVGTLLLFALGVSSLSCGAEQTPDAVHPPLDATTGEVPSGSGDADAPSARPDGGEPGALDARAPSARPDGGEPGAQPDAGGPSARPDGGDGGEQLDAGDGLPAQDVFGISKLYPTATDGREWDSRYWDGTPHDVPFGSPDPADPVGLANQRGDGTVRVEGDGTLRMIGAQPRLYIGTADDHPWRNVEITAYYQRLEDDDTNWAGLVIGARSGPDGHGRDNCTATTYYARFRNDGNVDIEKELEHPASLGRETKPLWNGADPPYGTWIGMKYIVTNVDAGQHVRLQVFRDQTEGRDGGTWEPIIDSTDTGGWSPEHSCDYAPDFIITQGGGVVLIRNTGAIGQGALYKWVTIREVDPP